MDVAIGSITFDCHDPPALARFWSQVTGHVFEADDEQWASLTDPTGRAPNLGFQRVPEGKVAKNRLHIDLHANDHEAAAARIKGLGATELWRSTNPEDPFIVLGDPEGNEFCVVHEEPGAD